MTRRGRIQGAIAAAVTPLTPGGDDVDEEAISGLVEFHVAAGVDGLLVLGTTGEGVLLSTDERRTVAARFLGSARDRMPVVVHCGAQSTRDTVALCEHAAGLGAAGVAVIAPPYYALDAGSILGHLDAAARACAPTPFYVYEFAARSGYAVPVSVVERLRSQAPNLAGLKVSDSPFERVEPYLLEGLDVFIGSEALIGRGLDGGAAGAVSGLAAALPELAIAAVRTRTPQASAHAGRVRDSIQGWPFQAALKLILRHRGVRIEPAVRGPLRRLDAAEERGLESLLTDPHGEIAPLLRA